MLHAHVHRRILVYQAFRHNVMTTEEKARRDKAKRAESDRKRKPLKRQVRGK